MIGADRTVTAERLREVLDYDPETGDFHWKSRPRTRRVSLGLVAGTLRPDGGRQICIYGRLYHSHRLAWLYVHGVWPENQIDHRNGVRADNRIANLRQATSAENHQNTGGPRSDTTSGFLGVTVDSRRGRWVARIVLNGKTKYLGSYTTPELAAAAYVSAKRSIHPFWDRQILIKKAGT